MYPRPPAWRRPLWLMLLGPRWTKPQGAGQGTRVRITSRECEEQDRLRSTYSEQVRLRGQTTSAQWGLLSRLKQPPEKAREMEKEDAKPRSSRREGARLCLWECNGAKPSTVIAALSRLCSHPKRDRATHTHADGPQEVTGEVSPR